MPELDPSSHDRGQPHIAASSLRSAQSAGFKSFLHLTDHFGGIPETGGGFDWKVYEYTYGERLLECVESSPELFRQCQDFLSVIDTLEFLKGGDEHFIHEGDGLIVKLTYGNNFGMRLRVYSGKMAGYVGPTVFPTGNLDHRYYLRRWILLNEAFPPITSFLGVVPPDGSHGERIPALAILQERLPGANPPADRIVRAFREIGFIWISENTYYRPEDNLLLGDAAPRNVRIVDGMIIPFDAIAENPFHDAREHCHREALRNA